MRTEDSYQIVGNETVLENITRDEISSKYNLVSCWLLVQIRYGLTSMTIIII